MTNSRKDITSFLSELLIHEKFSGIGKYWASEVSLDYGHGQGKAKRVDFMQFKPQNQLSISGLEKGEFTCYEIKSCKADIFSGHGLNFEGEHNYIVTTMETWKDLIANGQERIPHNVGIMVACQKNTYAEFENPTPLSETGNWRLEIIRNSHPVDRKRSITELLFCMLRSGH